ncbi:hypothetical protein QTI33_08040 [Variovorax sp. J22P271]|uniref:hypothetical protein n=1 Tax=Variovorax davisae TaxID=3053515 RepID=UPI002577F5C1|nr:hypothetical protein [Variovorax sp. J22P271]MDM0032088.1 hypothetical protein [Variovorax sp. J22P271]
MPIPVNSIRQTSQHDGLRKAQIGTVNGQLIEVVTGFDISHDRFPVHVYATPNGGERTKLPLGEIYGDDERSAFARGWQVASEYLRV